MLSWQSKLLNTLIHSSSRVLRLSSKLDIRIYRIGFEKFGQLFKAPKDIQIDKFKIKHLSAAWLTPPNCNSHVIIYLHGGAYIIGSINTHKTLMAAIAKKTGCRLLAINYRLAPEHPFPAALEDCIMTYEWLLSQNIPAEKIIIAGDSAGGGLAISTLLTLKEKKMLMPAAAACLSPWLDLTLSGDSFIYNAKKDPLMQHELGKNIVKFYLNGIDSKFPLASPLYADLSNLPPLFIQISETEVLYSEVKKFTEKAQQQNVQVTLSSWKNMLHSWQLLYPFLPEAVEAINQLSDYIVTIINSNERL